MPIMVAIVLIAGDHGGSPLRHWDALFHQCGNVTPNLGGAFPYKMVMPMIHNAAMKMADYRLSAIGYRLFSHKKGVSWHDYRTK
jgi:hypothetical protein